jgi:putative transposase
MTQVRFELIEPLIPPAKPGGRPQEVDMWAVSKAMLDVVVQGCK